jgi:hypothetical protein
VEETNYSDFSKKKIEQTGSCELLEERVEEREREGEESLEEIEEEEEKSNEKEQFGSHNPFYSDYLDMKSHLDICQPSPSYARGRDFQDDLIVIGTHLKIFPTPALDPQPPHEPRKQSEEDFIEEILEINFDPAFALREIPEEEEQL